MYLETAAWEISMPNFGGDCQSPVALPVPSNDGIGLHQGQGVGPIAPSLGQEHPKDPIALPQARTLDGALEDDDLLPQREIIKGELAAGPEDKAVETPIEGVGRPVTRRDVAAPG